MWARSYLRARLEDGKASAVEEAESGEWHVQTGLMRPLRTSAQRDERILLISGSHAGTAHTQEKAPIPPSSSFGHLKMGDGREFGGGLSVSVELPEFFRSLQSLRRWRGRWVVGARGWGRPPVILGFSGAAPS